MLNAEIARISLRIYHKLNKRKKNVEILGKKYIIMPNVFDPTNTFSTLLVAKNLPYYVSKNKEVLDLGCGSGILSIIAAKNGANVVAVDISKEATTCTKVNAKIHNVHRNVNVILGNLYEPLGKKKFDLIISNPPYLPLEPKDELDKMWCCGKDMKTIKEIVLGFPEHLKVGGEAIFTISSLTGTKEVEEILNKTSLKWEYIDKTRTPLDKIFLLRVIKHKEE